MSRLSEIESDVIAQLAVQLAKLAHDSGDAVFVMKMVAVACAAVVPGMRRPGESEHAAAGSLAMTTLTIIADELGINREQLFVEIAAGFDVIKRERAKHAQASTLVNAPGGVA
jgi:hypothetical protein